MKWEAMAACPFAIFFCVTSEKNSVILGIYGYSFVRHFTEPILNSLYRKLKSNLMDLNAKTLSQREGYIEYKTQSVRCTALFETSFEIKCI
jgi:hypothetical protein